MYYQKGLHIGRGHEREMFDFLKNHFRYYTLNSWNRLKSIANEVKVYRLGLPYDSGAMLDALYITDYEPINQAIYRWEKDHPGYRVGFNGRSDGYIVLYNDDNNGDAADLDSYDDYEEMKRWYAISDINYILRQKIAVVREFDKLCDELRAITAFMAEQYINSLLTEEDSNFPFDITFEELPKKFRDLTKK